MLLYRGFEFILGMENFQVITGLSIILATLVILIITKQKEWLWLMIAFFITPGILLTIQRLQPYHRVWIYLIFPVSLCILFIVNWLLKFYMGNRLIKNSIALVFSLMITGYTIFSFNNMTNHGFLMYDNVMRITDYIVQQKNVKVYTNDDSYNIFLRYQSGQRDQNLIPEMGSLTKETEFDYVLLTKNAEFPETIKADNYALKEKDDYIVVYKHK